MNSIQDSPSPIKVIVKSPGRVKDKLNLRIKSPVSKHVETSSPAPGPLEGGIVREKESPELEVTP